jgi:predicted site-specific integrase-resolvase
MQNTPVNLVDTNTVADRFNVTAEAVRSWAKKGRIPCVILPNGRYAFDMNEVLSATSKNPVIRKGKPILGASA